VPEDRTLIMSTASAELTKIASNALFAQHISSVNSLSVLCEHFGADASAITRVCGLNPRIGAEGLHAGLGFGGSCLRKDTLGLVGLANDHVLTQVAEYWRQVFVINDFQTSRFAERVRDLARRSSVKKVAVLGYAYKRDTGDARDSLAKGVILTLLKEGRSIELHDQLVPQKNIISDLMEGKIDSKLDITFHRTPYDACDGVQVAVIMNDSQQYRELDWKHISMSMLDEKIVVDGRVVTDEMKLEALSIVVERLGKGRRART
ncbi:hypothetical protein K469DRAFT_583030, partial [Zopfia rhizophila CBS 207.26]